MSEKFPVISLLVDSISVPDSLQAILNWGQKGRSEYVCFANVHMLVEAHRRPEFRDQVNGASLVLPDGYPVGKASKLLYGRDMERQPGMDYILYLLQMANDNKLGVFLYGSTEEVLAGMRDRIEKEFPDVKLCGSVSPPFRDLTAEEDRAYTDRINASGANLVLVGLGCPKQEKWMSEHKGRVNGVMFGLGGAFPVFARIHKRAPYWMQQSGLEWFYRLCQEPGRMFKRYLFTNTFFIYLLAGKLIRNDKVVFPNPTVSTGK